MSELFDEDPRDEPADRPPSRRSRALVITAIVLVLAFFGLTTFANFYTNVLWYRDIGFGGGLQPAALDQDRPVRGSSAC